MSFPRSTQPKFASFGALGNCPDSYVDRLAMAAVECGASCAARVLLHLRTLTKERNTQ